MTEKKANLGDYVDRGIALYEIADLSSVWVLFDVSNTAIKTGSGSSDSKLLEGQKVDNVLPDTPVNTTPDSTSQE